MQIKIEPISHSNSHVKTVWPKNSLDSKYRSMKYMSTQILMNNPPSKQTSMFCINKANINIAQNNHQTAEANSKTRINKIKSLMQPVFDLRVQSKILMQQNTKIKKQRVLHLLQLNKRTLQLKSKQQQKMIQTVQKQNQQLEDKHQQQNIKESTKQSNEKKQKISSLLSNFIQNKLKTDKSIYLGTSHTNIPKSQYCAHSKLKVNKRQQKSYSTLKNKSNYCKINHNKHKTQYDDIMLIDDQTKKQMIQNNSSVLKRSRGSRQKMKLTKKSEQSTMKNYFMQTKTRYDNENKAKNNQIAQEQFQKQKQLLKQNSSSIIRKSCLYLSSYLKIRCKKAMEQENQQQKGCKKWTTTLQSEDTITSVCKRKEPHIGGSHNIKKFKPNKQYYLKLRQQSIKKKSLISHYSKNNISKRNDNQKSAQRKSNNRKKSNQYSVSYEKPNITIDPW